MNTLKLSAVMVAAGLLVGAPAFAQTSPDAPKQMTAKQKTDGEGPTQVGPGSAAYRQRTDGEGPTVIGPASGAFKQKTQGVPGGAKPPVYGADWAKKQQ
jgi:hypothetical protein